MVAQRASVITPLPEREGAPAAVSSSLDTAVKRLALALDALDAAVERRRDADRNEETLAQQLHDLGVDRTRLASALDGEAARTRKLEDTNREIARRLDAALASIQTVLDAHE
jgi:predicted  nucleic acid-binding Zn-ribbon protein